MLNLLAMIYLQVHDTIRAIESIRKSLEINPRSEMGWNTSGAINFAIEEYKRSINDFTNALKINSKNSAVLYNLSCAYYSSGDTINASKYLKQALKYKVKFPSSKIFQF